MNRIECNATAEAIAELPDTPALFRLIKDDGKIIAHHDTPHLRTSIQALHESYNKNNFSFAKISYIPLIIKKSKWGSKWGYLRRRWKNVAYWWNHYRENPCFPEECYKQPYSWYWKHGINSEVLDLYEECQLQDNGLLLKKTADRSFIPKLDELMQKNHWRKDNPEICQDCLQKHICPILERMEITSICTRCVYPDDFTACDKRETGIKPILCPVCGKSDKISIILMNRQNKTHYYVLRCWNCSWKQIFPFDYSFLQDAPKPSEKKQKEMEVWEQYTTWCHDLLVQSGYYAKNDQWVDNLMKLLPKREK